MQMTCDMRRYGEASISVAPALPRTGASGAKAKSDGSVIGSRKPALPGKRDEYQDSIVPGLALRVTDRGHKSFVLVARYPSHTRNPTRRALGSYGALSLDSART